MDIFSIISKELMVFYIVGVREANAMCEVAVAIPNEVLYDTKMSKHDAVVFAKRAVALCYYTQNKVSLGYCAQIAGMTKEAFIRYLGENGISIFQYDDKQEFIEEINNA